MCTQIRGHMFRPSRCQGTSHMSAEGVLYTPAFFASQSESKKSEGAKTMWKEIPSRNKFTGKKCIRFAQAKPLGSASVCHLHPILPNSDFVGGSNCHMHVIHLISCMNCEPRKSSRCHSCILKDKSRDRPGPIILFSVIIYLALKTPRARSPPAYVKTHFRAHIVILECSVPSFPPATGFTSYPNPVSLSRGLRQVLVNDCTQPLADINNCEASTELPQGSLLPSLETPTFPGNHVWARPFLQRHGRRILRNLRRFS